MIKELFSSFSFHPQKLRDKTALHYLHQCFVWALNLALAAVKESFLAKYPHFSIPLMVTVRCTFISLSSAIPSNLLMSTEKGHKRYKYPSQRDFHPFQVKWSRIKNICDFRCTDWLKNCNTMAQNNWMCDEWLKKR